MSRVKVSVRRAVDADDGVGGFSPGEMASNVPSFLDFLESRKGTIDDLKYDSPFETVLPTTS